MNIDGLSTTLFIITLDAVIKGCNFTGTIINKAIQVVAYADDLAVIPTRDRKSLAEAVQKVEREASEKGLLINQGKSKYMEIRKENRSDVINIVKIGNYELEATENFKYLGVLINSKRDRSTEIDNRIQAGHRAYYKYKNLCISLWNNFR